MVRTTRKFFLVLALLALSTQSAFAASYNDRSYQIKVFDQQTAKEAGSDSAIESGVLVFVYTAGTRTLATIYKNAQRGTLANPISRANFASAKGVTFWGAASSYDIYLANSDGTDGMFRGVSFSQHSLSIDKSHQNKHLVIPFSPSVAETDTGIDLPYGALVYDAAAEVVTTDSAHTMDVGLLSSQTAGDADGFLAAVLMTTAGIPQNAAYTVGGSETYLSSVTYGVLLATKSLGNNTDTDVGSMVKLRHNVTGTNATRVTYTGNAGTTTAAGYIHLFFELYR